MKHASMLLFILLTSLCVPQVINVTARQRYPWNGKVDIVVTLTGASNDVANAECTFVATNSATHAALNVTHVTAIEGAIGSGSTWTRKFVWDATADVGEVKINDVALTVEAEKALGGVQLWENGPYWAECNVGATKPEEYGYYFWWGDTVGYKCNANNNGWVSVANGASFSFSGGNCPTYGKSTSQLQSAGYIDSTGNLVAAHDAATAHLGAPWRMPTAKEIADLISNCDTVWTTCNGVYGRLVTGRGTYASRSIFLPAAGRGSISSLNSLGSYGFYWSSTPDSDDSLARWAWYLNVCPDYFDRCGYRRCDGQPVRPLREFATAGVAFGASTTHLVLDTRTGTRYAHAEEPIAFSTDWSEGVTRLVLSVDGVNVLTTTTATNGVYVWNPDLSISRTVTLKHTTRGTVNEALTAMFTIAAYDVTFTAGAHGAFPAGVSATQRVPHGEAAVAPEVVPAAGYRFTGWSADTSSVTENVTATALYEAIPYVITYDDLHGATHANPSTYTIEDGVTFTAPNLIPQWQFVRWEPTSIPAGSTGAVTVRAVWEAMAMPCVYVDAARGDDTWDGSVAGQAVKTLARAYALAEPGDVIVVAAGTYAPVTAKGKAVTFRGEDGATIDGGGTSRCVTADDDVVFENFILQNGYDAEAGGGAYGGTFERCTIRDCHSDWDGAGAYEATLRNCMIVGNTAENGWGGGAYGGTLVGCVVKDNVAGDMGGGVFEPESLLDTAFCGNSPEDLADGEGKVVEGSSFVYAPSGSAVAYTVPCDWLLATGLAKVGDPTAGLDAKLAAMYANGYTGWESYVAGLNPNDALTEFRAAVTIMGGLVRISWTPDLNSNGVTRIYTVYGRTELEKGGWETPAQPWHRFFKVTVSMPTGLADEDTAVAGEGFVPEDSSADPGGVQLWKNGPYWAECNVGATKPEEYGYYFWWGDTVGYKPNTNNDGWISVANGTSFSFSKGNCPTYGKPTSELQQAGYIDSTGNLVASHDAATAHLGAPWRVPTSQEIDDLISNCTTTWTTRNGVYGQLVTGKGMYSSQNIFLPAAGYALGSNFHESSSHGFCMSSTLSDYSGLAWFLSFTSGYFARHEYYRYSGQPVRPVRGFAK